jgi:hypothetical protein
MYDNFALLPTDWNYKWSVLVSKKTMPGYPDTNATRLCTLTMGENAIVSDLEIQSITTTRQPADQEPPARFLRWTMKIGLFSTIVRETLASNKVTGYCQKNYYYLNSVYLAADRTQPIN